MSAYEPTSRRPIADLFRRTADVAVRLCVRWGVHPDLISYVSMVAAAAGAACFWQAKSYPVLLLIGPGFLYLRLWLNMLDGMVALAAGKASSRGEILNDLPDRVSDVLVFVGLAHSGLSSVVIGYWTAIAALLVAYVGTLGQAVGAQREFSGLMAKPWRMVAVHAGTWVTLGLLWWGDGRISFGGGTVLDWTCAAILLGCVQTIWIRLARIIRRLRAGGGEPRGD